MTHETRMDEQFRNIEASIRMNGHTVCHFSESRIKDIAVRAEGSGIKIKKFRAWRDILVCKTHGKCIQWSADPCCSDLWCSGRCPGHDDCFENGKGWKEVRSKVTLFLFYKGDTCDPGWLQ